ncbi:hypothetical protein B0H13DRAFT_1928243 [Mycena leptocephala]|nr:hypothetical protein B0H13DRAFT_1928243 [Mycena leptocephala]
MNTSISHLPLDVGQEIFSIVLFSDRRFSFSAFRKARWIICASSGKWMRVVHSCPVFWAHIIVETNSRPEIIRAHLSRAALRSMHICVVFENLDEYCQKHNLQDDDAVYELIADRLNLVHGALDRAVTLHIESDNDEALAAVRRISRCMVLPRLRDVVIRHKWHSMFRISTQDTQSYAWFTENLPRLETLHLHMIALPLATTALVALRHLRLFNIYANCDLRINDFVFVLSHALQLEELTIFDVYFSSKPSGDISSLSITTLRIGGGNTVAHLGPHFHFPQMRRLTMLLAQNTDVENILMSPRLLESIYEKRKREHI